MMPSSDAAVAALGAAVRSARKRHGLTQARLAATAKVSRLFVIELEAGHPRAELGKVLSVLDALGISPFQQSAQAGQPASTGISAAPEESPVSKAPGRTSAQTPGTPYEPPFVVADNLRSLHGPSTGEVVLPNRLLWNPSRPFDLSDEKRLRSMIRIVLREARPQDDLSEYVDRDGLIRFWDRLGLPDTLRKAWETRFPELVEADDR